MNSEYSISCIYFKVVWNEHKVFSLDPIHRWVPHNMEKLQAKEGGSIYLNNSNLSVTACNCSTKSLGWNAHSKVFCCFLCYLSKKLIFLVHSLNKYLHFAFMFLIWEWQSIIDVYNQRWTHLETMKDNVLLKKITIQALHFWLQVPCGANTSVTHSIVVGSHI